jgi:hypothetical protein
MRDLAEIYLSKTPNPDMELYEEIKELIEKKDLIEKYLEQRESKDHRIVLDAINEALNQIRENYL